MSQQGQQQQQPAKGTPEYNKQMAELYEQQQQKGDQQNGQSFQQQQQKPTKPAGVPDKFWNAEKGEVNYEAWGKSTSELEKSLTQKQQQKGDQQQQKDGQQSADDKSAQDAVNKAGLNWDALGEKIVDTGTIEDSDFEALEKAGIPRSVVEDYIAGINSGRESAKAKSEEFVGGKEVLNTILSRAASELTKEQIAFYNAQLRDPATYKEALTVLKARFAPGDGEPSSMLHGGGGSNTSVGFQSAYEQNEAINKRNERGQRLYDVDPAYRAQVRQRIALAKFR